MTPSMHPLLEEACTQAEQAISATLGRACPAPVRPFPRGTLSSAAPRCAGVDAQTLAGRLSLEGTWLESVGGENGFLNFTLSGEWCEAVCADPGEILPLPSLPPVETDFPAAVHPFDWAFLTALKGKTPEAALAARQDRENPGALVRMTLSRLEQVHARASLPRWTSAERALALRLASFAPQSGGKRQALYLHRLCLSLWELGPLNLSAPLNRLSRSVLSRGCRSVLQKIHP